MERARIASIAKFAKSLDLADDEELLARLGLARHDLDDPTTAVVR